MLEPLTLPMAGLTFMAYYAYEVWQTKVKVVCNTFHKHIQQVVIARRRKY